MENGADAVYFGLRGHNARARAVNFDGDDLPGVMALLHRRGVRGYVTLNTLAFPGELEGLEAIVRQLIAAGVDAVIVQDLGLVRLIRALTPDLEKELSEKYCLIKRESIKYFAGAIAFIAVVTGASAWGLVKVAVADGLKKEGATQARDFRNDERILLVHAFQEGAEFAVRELPGA